MTVPVLEILKRAKEILTPDGVWIQRGYSWESPSVAVSVPVPQAMCFCVLGAMDRAHWELEPSDEESPFGGGPEAISALGRHISQLTSIPEWNDHPGRTKESVLALLDAAIAWESPAEEVDK